MHLEACDVLLLIPRLLYIRVKRHREAPVGRGPMPVHPQTTPPDNPGMSRSRELESFRIIVGCIRRAVQWTGRGTMVEAGTMPPRMAPNTGAGCDENPRARTDDCDIARYDGSGNITWTDEVSEPLPPAQVPPWGRVDAESGGDESSNDEGGGPRLMLDNNITGGAPKEEQCVDNVILRIIGVSENKATFTGTVPSHTVTPTPANRPIDIAHELVHPIRVDGGDMIKLEASAGQVIGEPFLTSPPVGRCGDLARGGCGDEDISPQKREALLL